MVIWSIDWLFDWSIDWLFDWLIDWLIDWLVGKLGTVSLILVYLQQIYSFSKIPNAFNSFFTSG